MGFSPRPFTGEGTWGEGILKDYFFTNAQSNR
jgi:hypothetical protein